MSVHLRRRSRSPLSILLAATGQLGSPQLSLSVRLWVAVILGLPLDLWVVA